MTGISRDNMNLGPTTLHEQRRGVADRKSRLGVEGTPSVCTPWHGRADASTVLGEKIARCQ